MTRSWQNTVLGDIGATNARFAVLADGVIGPVSWFEVAQYPVFADVLGAFLEQSPGTPVTRALLAVAGPVAHGRGNFTNCPWSVDEDELHDRFGFETISVLNDFEATAQSLPYLAEDDLYRLGNGQKGAAGPMAVLGPGTGLGVACLVPGRSHGVVVASEGGHATVAAVSRREDAIIDHLRERFGHVSAERVISGPGLENLYGAIAAVDGLNPPPRNAAEITHAALKAACPIAQEALDQFCALLGSFAGNAALTFGARGGVFVAGGIAPRIAGYLARSAFRQRFESKGRFEPYLASIPSQVIMHAAATFVGLKALASRHDG